MTLDDAGPVAQEVIARGLSVRETEALVQRRGREPPIVTAPAKSVDALALERELTNAFGDRATIVWQRGGRGQLRLSFDSLERLEEILARLRG